VQLSLRIATKIANGPAVSRPAVPAYAPDVATGSKLLIAVRARTMVATESAGVTGSKLLIAVRARSMVATESAGVTGSKLLFAVRARSMVATESAGVTGSKLLIAVRATMRSGRDEHG
jgi:hypothetical protein